MVGQTILGPYIGYASTNFKPIVNSIKINQINHRSKKFLTNILLHSIIINLDRQQLTQTISCRQLLLTLNTTLNIMPLVNQVLVFQTQFTLARFQQTEVLPLVHHLEALPLVHPVNHTKIFHTDLIIYPFIHQNILTTISQRIH